MMNIGDFIKTIHFRYNNQPVNIHVVSKLELEDLMKLEAAAERHKEFS